MQCIGCRDRRLDDGSIFYLPPMYLSALLLCFTLSQYVLQYFLLSTAIQNSVVITVTHVRTGSNSEDYADGVPASRDGCNSTIADHVSIKLIPLSIATEILFIIGEQNYWKKCLSKVSKFLVWFDKQNKQLFQCQSTAALATITAKTWIIDSYLASIS